MDKGIEIALKELDLLSNSILKHEEIRLTLKNWLITLFTALTIALLSLELTISKWEYLFISLILLVLFLWLEVVYIVAQRRAMLRALNVESALRNEIKYDGPKMGINLGRPSSIKEQLKALDNVRVYSLYLILLVAIIMVFFIKS